MPLVVELNEGELVGGNLELLLKAQFCIGCLQFKLTEGTAMVLEHSIDVFVQHVFGEQEAMGVRVQELLLRGLGLFEEVALVGLDGGDIIQQLNLVFAHLINQ